MLSENLVDASAPHELSGSLPSTPSPEIERRPKCFEASRTIEEVATVRMGPDLRIEARQETCDPRHANALGLPVFEQRDRRLR